MADDLFPVLLRFHRDVILPDIEGIVSKSADSLEARMNARFDEVNGHFDAIYKGFDRLETEYHMLVAGPGQFLPACLGKRCLRGRR